MNSQRRRNRLFEPAKQPLESLQSGFQPHLMSSPSASLLRTQRCNRGRRTQTLLTYQLGLCDAATIIYLQDRKTSCSAHRFGEPAEAGQFFIMGRTDSLPGAPTLFDVSRGRNDSCEFAGGTSSDKFEFVFGSRPVFMGESVVSGAIANRFAISRPLLNLKGDQTTIDQTSVIPQGRRRFPLIRHLVWIGGLK